MPEQQRKPKRITPFEYEVIMNDFIDKKMPHLKGAEVKLVLVIIRKTWGGAYSRRALGGESSANARDWISTL